MRARRLIEAEFLGEPITGVHTLDGKPCAFYPYAGPCRAKVGGLLGLIKTRKGPIHGRFYMKGQFFLFEPGDFEIDADDPDLGWQHVRDTTHEWPT